MDNKHKFDVVIVGAGIIGLAIAEKLVDSFENILVLEKEKKFGQHTSSRNSEVIHSGIYHPINSLKSQLCIRGNDLLYEFFHYAQNGQLELFLFQRLLFLNL